MAPCWLCRDLWWPVAKKDDSCGKLGCNRHFCTKCSTQMNDTLLEQRMKDFWLVLHLDLDMMQRRPSNSSGIGSSTLACQFIYLYFLHPAMMKPIIRCTRFSTHSWTQTRVLKHLRVTRVSKANKPTECPQKSTSLFWLVFSLSHGV